MSAAGRRCGEAPPSTQSAGRPRLSVVPGTGFPQAVAGGPVPGEKRVCTRVETDTHSRWGIEDLVGNVWEWVADYYDAYSDADQEDPAGPSSGRTRAMRGGAWNGAYADWVRPSFRFHDAESTRSHGVGFRCAKTL